LASNLGNISDIKIFAKRLRAIGNDRDNDTSSQGKVASGE
jgi:hypothetical protein